MNISKLSQLVIGFRSKIRNNSLLHEKYSLSTAFHNIFVLVLMLTLISSLNITDIYAQSRSTYQQPERVMDVIGIKSGSVVGEIGAGDGFWTMFLAKRVGPEGKVYANDIDKDALRKLERKANMEGLENIEIIYGDVEDPKLENRKMDVIIMVWVLHHLDKPTELLNKLSGNLNLGGILAIIESDPKKRNSRNGHRMSNEEIIEEVQKANFELVRAEDFLSRDNLVIFKVKGGE